MRNIIPLLILLGFFLTCTKAISQKETQETSSENIHQTENKTNMKLGVFSVSLSVKDLEASKAFYENLGFEVSGGGKDQNYFIMKNGNALIGIFHGMFEGNILTFNPGWDENSKEVDPFDDVRTIQKQLKNNDIQLLTEADENTTGPSSIMVQDPDGNMILIDQHR